jgi:ubiquinone/menaquinone biosynthesis C-methylase UbiE
MAEENPLALLFQTFTAYQRTGALKGAIDLDLFTAIGEGNETAAALAGRCKASERGVRILCDALAALGFLHKRAGRYALDPVVGPFVDRRSPTYLGSASLFLSSPMVRDAFGDVAAAVRKGGTILSEQGTTEADHPIWVDFARAMAPIAGFTAQMLANVLDADAGRPWKVLDVAAGHGMFGITLAQRNPRAQVVALDWPKVLAVAKENAAKAGVGERLRLLPGDAFAVDWGKGHDLVLLPNFLHHFDPRTCETLLAKAHGALAPGGRAVTVEFVPDEDRVTPADAVTFGLVMLTMTPGGDVYTFAEYERMARNAGFTRSELHELSPSPQRVVVSYRS